MSKTPLHDLEEVTAREEEEAAALASALDSGQRRGVTADVLESAELLRYSGNAGELDPSRKKALLETALAGAEPSPEPSGWRLGGWRLGWSLAAAALCATFALVVLPPSRDSLDSPLPPPSRALLAAQVSAVEGSFEELDDVMGTYRSELYTALGTRYGADR